MLLLYTVQLVRCLSSVCLLFFAFGTHKEKLSNLLLTTLCCLLAGGDEEYIYMNKVVVGKEKDNKGVSFKRFLSEM